MDIFVSKILIPVICTILVSVITGFITYLKTRAKTLKSDRKELKDALNTNTQAVADLKNDVANLKIAVDAEHVKLGDYIARNDSATFTLLHDRLFEECQSAISEGHISIDDMENITKIFDSYTAMGGNGTGKVLYHKVCDLPLIGEQSNS